MMMMQTGACTNREDRAVNNGSPRLNRILIISLRQMTTSPQLRNLGGETTSSSSFAHPNWLDPAIDRPKVKEIHNLPFDYIRHLQNMHPLYPPKQFCKRGWPSHRITVPVVKLDPHFRLDLQELITRISSSSLPIIPRLSKNPSKEVFPHFVHDNLLPRNLFTSSLDPARLLYHFCEI